jgi:hypothetical protein
MFANAQKPTSFGVPAAQQAHKGNEEGNKTNNPSKQESPDCRLSAN